MRLFFPSSTNFSFTNFIGPCKFPRLFFTKVSLFIFHPPPLACANHRLDFERNTEELYDGTEHLFIYFHRAKYTVSDLDIGTREAVRVNHCFEFSIFENPKIR